MIRCSRTARSQNHRMHQSRGAAAFSNQASLAATAVMRGVRPSMLIMENPFSPPTRMATQRIRFADNIPPIVACLGTALLLIAVAHVRSDRSHSRQPIVTFVTPLSNWVPTFVYMGLGLSLVGFLGAAIIVKNNDGDVPRTASVAIFFAIVNALGTFFAYFAIWED